MSGRNATLVKVTEYRFDVTNASNASVQYTLGVPDGSAKGVGSATRQYRISDVDEIGDEFPVVIGQVPLELMDWVVDPKRQRLIGNPEHGGEQMIDIL
jgi:hypothetical protein